MSLCGRVEYTTVDGAHSHPSLCSHPACTAPCQARMGGAFMRESRAPAGHPSELTAEPPGPQTVSAELRPTRLATGLRRRCPPAAWELGDVAGDSASSGTEALGAWYRARKTAMLYGWRCDHQIPALAATQHENAEAGTLIFGASLDYPRRDANGRSAGDARQGIWLVDL